MRAALVRHPGAATGGVRGIEAALSRDGAGALAVSYVLEGDPGRLRIPPWSGVHEGERLWEHTCFEIFVAMPGAPAYHELNFAPSGAWAVYAFRDYRERVPGAQPPLEPDLAVRCAPRALELRASFALERLSPAYLRAPLELGISAVIEDGEGGLSYWALAHPGAKPDFHHREGFVLKMDPGSSPG